MKLLVVLALVSACSAAQLDRAYLPPFGARNAGGSDGALQAPNYNQQNRPQNQYGQPSNAQRYTAYSSDPDVQNAYLPPFEQGQGRGNSHAQSVAQQYGTPQLNRQQKYQTRFNQDGLSGQFDGANENGESDSSPSQYFGNQGQQTQQEYQGQQEYQRQQGQTRFGSLAPRFGGQPQYNNPSEFGGRREAPSFSPESGYKY